MITQTPERRPAFLLGRLVEIEPDGSVWLVFPSGVSARVGWARGG